MQLLLVALIVLGCSAYAVWTLMPAAWRAGVASMLLRWPLPAVLSTRLRTATRASSGCGSCGSCASAAKAPAAAAVHTVTFHKRLPR